MGEIVQDSTYEPGSVEFIEGYRSSPGSSGNSVKNTCDIQVTAYNPFDFDVDWRLKWVKTRKPYVSRSGRKYYRNVRVAVSYPYYTFKVNTRSVREWRLIASAGGAVLKRLPPNFKGKISQVVKVLGWLTSRLEKYGPCRIMKPRSPHIQHNVTHWKSEIDKIIPFGYYYAPGGAFSVPWVTNNQYGYRAFELESNYVGETGGGPNVALNSALLNPTINVPQSIIFSNDTVETVTAMLWPSSGDFEDIGSSPLVDVSEAAADGVFPLGPPPNAFEAHERMVKNAMSNKDFAMLTDIVDFAADSYLWTTLVLAPIIQSAIGLSVAVEANDKAIDAFTSKAANDKWHQGKSLRLFGKSPQQAAECLGIPPALSYNVVNTGHEGTLTHSIDFKKLEANASFNYRLSQFDAAQMNTSGARLGQFFNRMSTSFETVLHNVLPLSFVYDWFSSEYTGILNLKDKVYMPVADWKLTLSYNCKIDVTSRASTSAKYHTDDVIAIRKTTNIGAVINSRIGLNHLDGLDRVFLYDNSYYWYFSDNRANFTEVVKESETRETHEFYRRLVYDRPIRRTDFSGDIDIQCLDTTKYGALEDTGKLVTLGALLWGFIPG